MVFSSIEFVFIFLPIVLAIYYIVPFKAKNIVLLVASLVFYSWGEPVYVLLMLAAALVGYVNGLLQKKFAGTAAKRASLVVSLILNIGILLFYKYSDFIIDIINSAAGRELLDNLNLSLPIGISFYTFQIISYSIDVYRKPEIVEKNYFMFLTYVSMFPQLIAGPIVRYETIRQNLHSRKITLRDYSVGFKRFMFGLFKKVLIANNIGILWDSIKGCDFGEISVATAWLGAIAFTLQLYFDFSGYGDMAIGMGKMLGFEFNENFNYPFYAKSITDFWRRWHMSLAQWFRDYVYIPLGGNRCSTARNIFNIIVVWALTGLWHGANWNFILWGVYYGVILLLEKFVYGKQLDKLSSLLKHIYTIIMALIGFVVFVFEDMSQLTEYIKIMFTGNMGLNCLTDSSFMFYISDYGILLLVSVILSMPVYKMLSDKIQNAGRGVKTTAQIISSVVYFSLFVVSVAYLVSASYNPFLYFKF